MLNKKILSALLLGFGLTACQASTSINDASENLMTIGNKSYDRGTEYQVLKRVSGPALTLAQAQEMIAREEITDMDGVEQEANEQYEEYAASSETFEEDLKEYGYEDKEDYIEKVLVPNVLLEKLQNKYYEDNAEDLEAEYSPALVRIIETDSEDNANRALEALKNGEDPAAVGEQYASETATYRGEETLLLSDDTSLPAELVNTVMDTSKDGVIDEVFTTDTSTDEVTYYVADIVTKDYNELLEQFADHFNSDQQMRTDATVYYLEKYDFEVHDQYLFDYWKVKSPEYLVTRPDLMENPDAK